MAGDWIKMRTDLYRDPKVCVIADLLMDKDGELARYVNQNCQRDMTVTRNVMRNVTVGALVTLWGVTRHRGKRNGDDLILRNMTVSVIDDITELPGLGDAMAFVGWAIAEGENVVFPRFFEEYNEEPGESQKKKNAERQRRYREKNNALRNVTVAPQSNAREEKRRGEEKREEKKTNTAPSASVAVEHDDDPVQVVYGCYRKHHPRMPAVLDRGSKEYRLIAARLKEFDAMALMDAIEGCHVSPFHCGQNDRQRKYQSLGLIFRDADHVQNFIELAQGPGGPVLSATTQVTMAARESFLARSSELFGESEGEVFDVD